MPPIHNGSALGDWGTHDPTMLKTQDGQYVHYRTNYNVAASISNDRQTFHNNGSAFPGGIPWARNWTYQTPDAIWAPDVHYHNGKYYMYYSAWKGETIAAIGLAISESGRPGEWVDQGMVFNSLNTTFNAIDPDLLIDTDGRWYLVFGSYLSGIYQYEMDPNTGFVKEGSTPVHLAHRGDDKDDAIEGSGMFKKGKIVSFHCKQESFPRSYS
uniref:Endo-1,5-alpha-L-arabinanase A n=1 Tax=Acrobeloides nanus TaxID=290746 RepID=A0A914DYG0_9BILA